MARILSVTFETEAAAEPGRFSVPRRVVDFLDIRPDDPVEVVVMHEGLRLELTARIGTELEIRHQPGDGATVALLQVPSNAPLEVTIWGLDAPADRPGPASRAEQWNPQRFDEDAERRAGPEVLARARRVRDWAQQRGLRLWWGRGREWGSWIPVLDAPSKRSYQWFSAWSSGSIEIQTVYLKRNPSFADEAPREQLRRRLNAISGISLPPEAVDGRRSFRLADLPDEASVEEVLSVFDWVLDELRKGDP